MPLSNIRSVFPWTVLTLNIISIWIWKLLWSFDLSNILSFCLGLLDFSSISDTVNKINVLFLPFGSFLLLGRLRFGGLRSLLLLWTFANRLMFRYSVFKEVPVAFRALDVVIRSFLCLVWGCLGRKLCMRNGVLFRSLWLLYVFWLLFLQRA